MDDGGLALMADNRMNNGKNFKLELAILWGVIATAVLYLLAAR